MESFDDIVGENYQDILGKLESLKFKGEMRPIETTESRVDDLEEMLLGHEMDIMTLLKAVKLLYEILR